MTISKILMVIEHEPADIDESGAPTTGAVVGIHASVPAEYLDVVVRESVVTERNRNAGATAWQADLRHPLGRTPYSVPFEPSGFEEARGPARPRDGAIQQWIAKFWEKEEMQAALILGASDVVTAAQRVRNAFPHCRIVSIQESWPQDAPAIADHNEIVLLPED